MRYSDEKNRKTFTEFVGKQLAFVWSVLLLRNKSWTFFVSEDQSVCSSILAFLVQRTV